MDSISLFHRTKNFPYHSVNISLDSPLQAASQNGHAGELVNFITTAVKFFLFQRNQIPVPFDQISSSGRTVPVGDERNQRLSSGSHTDAVYVQDDEISDSHSCKDRILYLRKRREAKLKQKLLSNKIRKHLQDEERICECWAKVFGILRSVLTVQAENLVAFVLMFGQSTRNPRETILFQFNTDVIKCQAQTNIAGELEWLEPGQSQGSGSTPAAIRKIFKNIIMSPAFPEFTSKPLQNTNTHLCILTKTPIPETERTCADLILVNDFVIPGSEAISQKTGCPFKPILHVNLERSNDDMTSDVFEFDLFNKTSLSCYQIPVQFRGIQWRKN